MDLARPATAADRMSSALDELRDLARVLDAESCLIHLELVERTLRGKLTLSRGAVVATLVETALEPKVADAWTRPAARMFIADYSTPRIIDGVTLSRYQANVLHWVEREDGDGQVEAVAGAGKTSTLIMVAKVLPTEGLFLAFNKNIAEELGKRLAGTKMAAKTIHSVGMDACRRAFGRVNLDDFKYRKLADQEAARLLPPAAALTAARALSKTLQDLAGFARLTLTDPRDAAAMQEMAERYNIDLPANGTAEDDRLTAELFAATERILQAGIRLASERTHTIDYTDMIWLPSALNLTPMQAPFVAVDECQDLNRAQLELVLKTRAPGGRMLFVGDPAQAIYGFAGADAESFWNIQRRTNATLMELSVCYRCPAAVLDLARDIVPHIEAAPNAPTGTVRYVKEAKVADELVAGDMVLCRLTAPLVSLCLDLIGRGMPAKVRGRNIGEQLVALVRKVAELDGYTWDGFGEYLTKYQEVMVAKLARRQDAEAAIEALEDKVNAVRVCFERFEASSADHLSAKIEALFAKDSERDLILLSTVHRAKGLENPRVYILRPKKLPLSWPKQTEAEAAQELNLRYVAITRAQKELVWVEED